MYKNIILQLIFITIFINFISCMPAVKMKIGNKCEDGNILKDGKCVSEQVRYSCVSGTSITLDCSNEILHGSGIKARNCINGSWSNYQHCLLTNCDINYNDNDRDGNCEPNNQCTLGTTDIENCSDQIDHGSGVKRRTCNSNGTWGEFKSCSLTLCDSNYNDNDHDGDCDPNQCIEGAIDIDDCSDQIDHGSGVKRRICNNNGIWGEFESCQLTACYTDYNDNNRDGICEPDLVVECNSEDTEASDCSAQISHGSGERVRTCNRNKTWNPFGNCNLTSCDANYDDNDNNGTCELSSSNSSNRYTGNNASITDYNQMTLGEIQDIMARYNFYYLHTSHGSQLLSGINNIDGLNKNNFKSYREVSTDLGSSSWNSVVTAHLNRHPNVNLVSISWCGQLSSGSTNVQTYLSKMTNLERAYPNVTFIYQTGHPKGAQYNYSCSANKIVSDNNDAIRAHTTLFNKYLFDFDDLDSHKSVGAGQCQQSCSSGDLPEECSWTGNSQYSCAHSHSANCDRKGRAFLALLAYISGRSF